MKKKHQNIYFRFILQIPQMLNKQLNNQIQKDNQTNTKDKKTSPKRSVVFKKSDDEQDGDDMSERKKVVVEIIFFIE